MFCGNSTFKILETSADVECFMFYLFANDLIKDLVPINVSINRFIKSVRSTQSNTRIS